MSDHSDLVAEIPSVERMGTQERLKHARKRRSQQLKKWSNYEKQLEKETTKKSKKGQPPPKKNRRTKNTRVKFKGNIMLLESAARNDLDDVKRLLSAGVNPDVTNEDGLTALHQCCIDDNEDMLKLLLEFGALVNARDSELWTPLHAAATCGHAHLCRYLIDKGAELLAVNADGNMPYDICEDEVTLDYIETEMAKRGITQEEIDETRLIPERQMLSDLKLIAKRGGDLEVYGPEGATPLHIAAANGYQEVAEFLLDHHVSVDRRDFDSWQPIHAAACWLQPEILEILVRNGADIDAKTKNGETAFDLCEDAEIRQKILDMKDEIETNKASRTKDNVRRSKHTSRSASIRRSSMRGEKNPLFMKEAREEALHFGWRQGGPEEDLVEDEKENNHSTNIDDVQLIIDDDQEKIDKEKESPKSVDSPPPSKQPKHTSPSSPRESDRSPKVAKQQATDHRQPTRAQRPDSSTTVPRSNRPDSVSQNVPNQKTRRQSPPSKMEAPRRAAPQQPRETQPDKARNSIPKSVAEEQRRIQQERAGSSSPKVSSNSYQPGNAGQAQLANVRYPSGTTPITLSDLKRQRAESRSRENSLTDISSQVQNMFLNSLGSNDTKKYSSSSLHTKDPHTDKNGHSTNNNTQGYHPEAMHKFKAPNNHPVAGEEEKQGCCVVM